VHLTQYSTPFTFEHTPFTFRLLNSSARSELSEGKEWSHHPNKDCKQDIVYTKEISSTPESSHTVYYYEPVYKGALELEETLGGFASDGASHTVESCKSLCLKDPNKECNLIVMEKTSDAKKRCRRGCQGAACSSKARGVFKINTGTMDDCITCKLHDTYRITDKQRRLLDVNDQLHAVDASGRALAVRGRPRRLESNRNEAASVLVDSVDWYLGEMSEVPVSVARLVVPQDEFSTRERGIYIQATDLPAADLVKLLLGNLVRKESLNTIFDGVTLDAAMILPINSTDAPVFRVSLHIKEIEIIPEKVGLTDVYVSGGVVGREWTLSLSTRLWTKITDAKPKEEYGPFSAEWNPDKGLTLKIKNVKVHEEFELKEAQITIKGASTALSGMVLFGGGNVKAALTFGEPGVGFRLAATNISLADAMRTTSAKAMPLGEAYLRSLKVNTLDLSMAIPRTGGSIIFKSYADLTFLDFEAKLALIVDRQGATFGFAFHADLGSMLPRVAGSMGFKSMGSESSGWMKGEVLLSFSSEERTPVPGLDTKDPFSPTLNFGDVSPALNATRYPQGLFFLLKVEVRENMDCSGDMFCQLCSKYLGPQRGQSTNYLHLSTTLTADQMSMAAGFDNFNIDDDLSLQNVEVFLNAGRENKGGLRGELVMRVSKSSNSNGDKASGTQEVRFLGQIAASSAGFGFDFSLIANDGWEIFPRFAVKEASLSFVIGPRSPLGKISLGAEVRIGCDPWQLVVKGFVIIDLATLTGANAQPPSFSITIGAGPSGGLVNIKTVVYSILGEIAGKELLPSWLPDSIGFFPSPNLASSFGGAGFQPILKENEVLAVAFCAELLGCQVGSQFMEMGFKMAGNLQVFEFKASVGLEMKIGDSPEFEFYMFIERFNLKFGGISFEIASSDFRQGAMMVFRAGTTPRPFLYFNLDAGIKFSIGVRWLSAKFALSSKVRITETGYEFNVCVQLPKACCCGPFKICMGGGEMCYGGTGSFPRFLEGKRRRLNVLSNEQPLLRLVLPDGQDRRRQLRLDAERRVRDLLHVGAALCPLGTHAMHGSSVRWLLSTNNSVTGHGNRRALSHIAEKEQLKDHGLIVDIHEWRQKNLESFPPGTDTVLNQTEHEADEDIWTHTTVTTLTNYHVPQISLPLGVYYHKGKEGSNSVTTRPNQTRLDKERKDKGWAMHAHGWMCK